jgi:hypothetical protein
MSSQLFDILFGTWTWLVILCNYHNYSLLWLSALGSENGKPSETVYNTLRPHVLCRQLLIALETSRRHGQYRSTMGISVSNSGNYERQAKLGKINLLSLWNFSEGTRVEIPWGELADVCKELQQKKQYFRSLVLCHNLRNTTIWRSVQIQLWISKFQTTSCHHFPPKSGLNFNWTSYHDRLRYYAKRSSKESTNDIASWWHLNQNVAW